MGPVADAAGLDAPVACLAGRPQRPQEILVTGVSAEAHSGQSQAPMRPQ